MKTTLIVAVLVGLFSIPVYAIDNNSNPQDSELNVEQKKTEILKQIDERIVHEQEERVCVQAAQSHIELKACRDKYRPKQNEHRQPRNQ